MCTIVTIRYKDKHFFDTLPTFVYKSANNLGKYEL